MSAFLGEVEVIREEIREHLKRIQPKVSSHEIPPLSPLTEPQMPRDVLDASTGSLGSLQDSDLAGEISKFYSTVSRLQGQVSHLTEEVSGEAYQERATGVHYAHQCSLLCFAIALSKRLDLIIRDPQRKAENITISAPQLVGVDREDDKLAEDILRSLERISQRDGW